MLALTLVLACAPFTPAQELRRTPVVDVVRAQGDGVVTLVATHVLTLGGAPVVGSGSIIHGSGYVLTTAQVVAAASELNVVLANGRVLTAHLVGALPDEDLALLKVDVPRGVVLHAVSLGGGLDLMIGEGVITIGAEGVASSILAARARAVGGRQGLLQLDRGLGARSSGGPCFDAVGVQIGVTTSVAGESAGFAVAVDRVPAFLARVLAVEGRRRLLLGLTLSPAPGDRRGVAVASVARGGPAAKAGLAPGMIIVEVDGRPTISLVEALVAFFEAPAGPSFTVRAILPEGTTDSFAVTLEARPPSDGKHLARLRLGLEVADLDAADAARLGVRADAGVLVNAVDRGTSAAGVGIATGDLLTRIGPYAVRTLTDLAVLDDVNPGSNVAVHAVRIGKGQARSVEANVLAR